MIGQREKSQVPGIQYVPIKPQKVSAAGKCALGARTLTSDECVHILAE